MFAELGWSVALGFMVAVLFSYPVEFFFQMGYMFVSCYFIEFTKAAACYFLYLSC